MNPRRPERSNPTEPEGPTPDGNEDDGVDRFGVLISSGFPREVREEFAGHIVGFVEMSPGALGWLVGRAKAVASERDLTRRCQDYEPLGPHPGMDIRLVLTGLLSADLREEFEGQVQLDDYVAVNRGVSTCSFVGPGLLRRLQGAGERRAAVAYSDGTGVGWSESLDRENPILTRPAPVSRLLDLAVLSASGAERGRRLASLAERDGERALRLLEGEPVKFALGEEAAIDFASESRETLLPLLEAERPELRRRALRLLGTGKESRDGGGKTKADSHRWA